MLTRHAFTLVLPDDSNILQRIYLVRMALDAHQVPDNHCLVLAGVGSEELPIGCWQQETCSAAQLEAAAAVCVRW